VGHFVRDLVIVTVSNHVILENSASEPGKADASGLDMVARTFDVLFCAFLNKFGCFCFSAVVEPGFIPVAVRTEDARDFPRDVLGPIKCSGQEKAGTGFKVDLFGSKVSAVN
jgi:hypothetical protein